MFIIKYLLSMQNLFFKLISEVKLGSCGFISIVLVWLLARPTKQQESHIYLNSKYDIYIEANSKCMKFSKNSHKWPFVLLDL